MERNIHTKIRNIAYILYSKTFFLTFLVRYRFKACKRDDLWMRFLLEEMYIINLFVLSTR